MKQITIAGNIGKDAQVRRTQDGTAVASWPVAVEERGAEKRTLWFDCSLWGNRGEKLAPFLTKGGKVAVSGELSTREHEGKTYLTVRADQVTLLGGGERGVSSASTTPREPGSAQTSIDLSDEIPF